MSKMPPMTWDQYAALFTLLIGSAVIWWAIFWNERTR
jgi:hypothetical protein